MLTRMFPKLTKQPGLEIRQFEQFFHGRIRKLFQRGELVRDQRICD